MKLWEPTNDFWLNKNTLPCLLGLFTSYLSSSTVDVFSSENDSVLPLISNIKTPVYVSDRYEAPQRLVSVNALFIVFSSQDKSDFNNVDFGGSYGKVVVITNDVNSVQPLWNRSRIADALILVPNNSSVDAYTWFPYNSSTCHRPSEVFFLESCTKNDLWKSNLFPYKVSRQSEGCPVRFTTIGTGINVVKTQAGFADIEVEFMKILTESLKFSFVLIPFLHDITTFFDISDERSAFRLVKRGKSDFAFGTLILDSGFNGELEPLPIFSENSVVWMIPTPNPKSKTIAVFSTFSLYLWLIIISVFIASLIIAAIFRNLMSNHNAMGSWLDLVALCVASPIKIRPDPTFWRFFIFTFQLYSLHMAWFYQFTLLGHLFNTPMERQLNVEEALDSGLPAILYSWSDSYFNASGDGTLWKKIWSNPNVALLGNDTYDFETTYKQIVEDKSAILMGYLADDGYWIRRRYRRRLASLVHVERFINTPVTMYGHRGSLLTSIFKQQMLHLIETGIYLRLTNMIDNANNSARRDSAPEALKFELLRGAFILHATLCAFICGVFLKEKFSIRSQ